MKYLQPSKIFQIVAGAAAPLLFSATQVLAQLDRIPDSPLRDGQDIEPIQNYGIAPDLTDYNGAVTGRSFVFYLVFIWRALIFIAGLAVLINLVIGAIDWINAGGDKGKIEKARDKMSQAVIGFVVLVGLLAIAQFLNVIFGINLLELDIPTVNDERFTP